MVGLLDDLANRTEKVMELVKSINLFFVSPDAKQKTFFQIERELKSLVIAVLKAMPSNSKIQFIAEGQVIFTVKQLPQIYEYTHQESPATQSMCTDFDITTMINGLVYYLVSHWNSHDKQVLYISNP